MRKESPVVRVTAQARWQQSPLTPYATRGHITGEHRVGGGKPPKGKDWGYCGSCWGSLPLGDCGAPTTAASFPPFAPPPAPLPFPVLWEAWLDWELTENRTWCNSFRV